MMETSSAGANQQHHRGPRRRSCWLLPLLLVAGCTGRDSTPEGVVKTFLQEVEVGRLARAYEMLDPGSQQRLQDLSQMAGAQTGGRSKFKPEDILVTGIAKARHRVGEIKAAQVTAQRAEVTVTSADKKHSETFRLTRHDGRWRVVLPVKIVEQMLKARGGKPGPASRPAGTGG